MTSSSLDQGTQMRKPLKIMTVIYLVTTDCYTNFFELDVLVSRTSKEVITKRKPHFARYGLPDRLITDNVP